MKILTKQLFYKTLVFGTFSLSLFSCGYEKQISDILNNSSGSSAISNAEVISGLKNALVVGAENSVLKTNKIDGFFSNQLIKIAFPQEMKDAENYMRNSLGLGKLVDNFELKLNRAAEDAAKEATPIFKDAITQMTIADGMNILYGGDYAATNYLKQQTTQKLISAFYPKINASLSKVGAADAWKLIATPYNKVANMGLANNLKPVPGDITQYATSKAIDGLFTMIANEEKDIRKNPLARVNDILKKVFGQLDKK